MKNGKKLYKERGITFFHETERYVNNLNIYNRSKNGTNLWDDLIHGVGNVSRIKGIKNKNTILKIIRST